MNLNSSYCVGWRLFSLYGMGKKPELGLMNQDLAPENNARPKRPSMAVVWSSTVAATITLSWFPVLVVLLRSWLARRRLDSASRKTTFTVGKASLASQPASQPAWSPPLTQTSGWDFLWIIEI
ncbi:hypothetical protein GQ607_001679 [Colletotrichum asianum]|uniref:Uncharacterized protein n=1 Tax=Colletotrichum asianum TaxID=702518 RepID=A0A8H3WR35_9PEZI|nr:hypothetical protein GQ607_001679 [Colletotrichum asianum]